MDGLTALHDKLAHSISSEKKKKKVVNQPVSERQTHPSGVGVELLKTKDLLNGR